MRDDYYFVPYGKMIIEEVKPKMWIFGYIHINFNDCRLFCNPLEFPNENKKFKIESVKI